MDDIIFEDILKDNINISEIHKFINDKIINCKLYKLLIFEIKYRNYIKMYPYEKYIYPKEIEKNIDYYNYIVNERKIYFSNGSRLFKEFLNIDSYFSEYSIFR